MRYGNASAVTPAELRAALDDRLPSRAWFDAALAEAAAAPAEAATALPRLIAQAGRCTGREPLGAAGTAAQVPVEALVWTVDDAVRALLIAAAAPGPELLTGLYFGGDAAERRGVLRALNVLPGDGGRALVADALRSNDTRLVAAALGPYGARTLEAAAYRQAVLKCLHCGIPLSAVAGLPERLDAPLLGLALGYAQELASADRPLSADLITLTTSPLRLRLRSSLSPRSPLSPCSGKPCVSSTRTST